MIDDLKYNYLNFDWGTTHSAYIKSSSATFGFAVYVREGEQIMNIYEDAKIKPNEQWLHHLIVKST